MTTAEPGDGRLEEFLADPESSRLDLVDLASVMPRRSECGHPTPLLIRDRRLLVDAVRREPDPPMGLPSACIFRATAVGEPAPETLRRLIHSVLDSPTSRLRDDATILMFEWTPPSR
ncbi:hypothetical protein [Streptomyces sp. NPDC002788]